MIPTREELERLRELAGKATPGPWRYDPQGQIVTGRSVGGCNMQEAEHRIADIRGWGHLQYRPDGEAIQDANGALIAAANPAMIAHLLACEAALRELVECKRLEDNYANGRHDYKLAHDDCQNCADGRESDRRTPPAWSAARALIGGSHD